MRRFCEFLILGFVLIIPAALRAQEQLTVLYPSPAGSWMIPVIAKEAKYFEKEGLAVEYVRVGGGSGSSQRCSAAARKLPPPASRQWFPRCSAARTW